MTNHDQSSFDRHVEEALALLGDELPVGKNDPDPQKRQPSKDPDPTRPIRRERPTPPPEPAPRRPWSPFRKG